jgi:hypothetical protein
MHEWDKTLHNVLIDCIIHGTFIHIRNKRPLFKHIYMFLQAWKFAKYLFPFVGWPFQYILRNFLSFGSCKCISCSPGRGLIFEILISRFWDNKYEFDLIERKITPFTSCFDKVGNKSRKMLFRRPFTLFRRPFLK